MCFTGTQRRGTIVVFVDIQQILLPLQKTFFSFTWYNKETFYFFFPSTVLEAELAGGEHTHKHTNNPHTSYSHCCEPVLLLLLHREQSTKNTTVLQKPFSPRSYLAPRLKTKSPPQDHQHCVF